MSEIEPIQSSEELESEEEVKATRELDETTHEPGSRVEKVGSTGQSEAIEASVANVVDNTLETTPSVSETPQRLDKELDEARTQGKQMTEKDLEGEMDPTKGIEDFQDPFGVDKSLDGGPLDSPHGPGGQGAGASQMPEGFDPGMGAPKEFPDPQSEKELPTGVGGAPILNPAKGPWAQGMAAEDGDKGGDYSQRQWQIIQLMADCDEDAKDATAAFEKNPSEANAARYIAAIENYNEAAEIYKKTFGMYPGSGQQTPNPVGDDGYVAPPKSEDDIDKSKSPGVVSLEADVQQTGKPGGSIDASKSGSFVTDPAEGDSKIKDGGGLQAGQELITDPPEEDAGKDAAETKG